MAKRLHLSRAKDGEHFLAAVVGLGSLGVVTRVTLDLLPTFQVAQSVYQNLSLDHLKTHLDEIFSSGYSVSVFTDWQNHMASAMWIKRHLAAGRQERVGAGVLRREACHCKSFIRLPATTPKVAPSSREFRAPGTSACRTSA